jgi:hypothetical protein
MGKESPSTKNDCSCLQREQRPLTTIAYSQNSRPFPLQGKYYANLFIHFEPTGRLLKDVGNDDRLYDTPGNPGLYDEENILLPPYLIPGSPEASFFADQVPSGWDAPSHGRGNEMGEDYYEKLHGRDYDEDDEDEDEEEDYGVAENFDDSTDDEGVEQWDYGDADNFSDNEDNEEEEKWEEQYDSEEDDDGYDEQEEDEEDDDEYMLEYERELVWDEEECDEEADEADCIEDEDEENYDYEENDREDDWEDRNFEATDQSDDEDTAEDLSQPSCRSNLSLGVPSVVPTSCRNNAARIVSKP